MLNGKNVEVLERSTFVDEFENIQELEHKRELDRNAEERLKFNSHIKDNFDRILHQDYTETGTDSVAYGKIETTTVENEDLREVKKAQTAVETKYASKSKYSLKTVLTMVVLGVMVVLLPILVVRAGQMLNEMDAIINEKTSQIESLYEELNSLEDELAYESSDEVIIDKAKEFGMIE